MVTARARCVSLSQRGYCCHCNTVVLGSSALKLISVTAVRCLPQPVVEMITRNVLDRFLNPEVLGWDQTPPLGEGPRSSLPHEVRGAARL